VGHRNLDGFLNQDLGVEVFHSACHTWFHAVALRQIEYAILLKHSVLAYSKKISINELRITWRGDHVQDVMYLKTDEKNTCDEANINVPLPVCGERNQQMLDREAVFF
jgi:hypothetical protein